jgi:hypothetical protein
MTHWRKLAILLFLLCFAPAALAQTDCPTLVTTALETATSNCDSTGRNQACYGNITLIAEAQDNIDDFHFEQAGDLADVAAIQSLQLSSYDADAGVWGVALMKLHANLSQDVPDDVTLLLFGDVTIENRVGGVTLQATTNASARARSAPTTEANNVLMAIPPGTQVTLNGRTDVGDWLRVILQDRGGMSAWVSASLLNITGDATTLDVVKASDPVFGAMQAFYLKTGVDDRPCAEAPDSGLLIQTPEGAGTVSFLVNEVNIELGSTAYIQSGNNTMTISVVEGRAKVQADNVTQFVPAGTATTVPLTPDGRSPDGAPTFPQPYDYAALLALPVGIAPAQTLSLPSPLPEAVEVAPAVLEDEVSAAIGAAFAPYGGMDGMYVLNYVPGTLVVHVPANTVDGACVNGPPQWTMFLRFTESGVESPGLGLYPRIGDGVFGDGAAAHSSSEVTTLPASGSRSATTITMTSMTNITIRSSGAYNENGSTGACSFTLQGSWVRPLPPGLNFG